MVLDITQTEKADIGIWKGKTRLGAFPPLSAIHFLYRVPSSAFAGPSAEVKVVLLF